MVSVVLNTVRLLFVFAMNGTGTCLPSCKPSGRGNKKERKAEIPSSY